MCVDVCDFIGADVCILNGKFQRPCNGSRIGVRDVRAVCVRSEAGNLCIYGGAAFNGMLHVLKDNRCGTFPDDQSVAVFVKGFRLKMRCIVQYGSCRHRVEYRCIRRNQLSITNDH